jgi:hypothetical protein
MICTHQSQPAGKDTGRRFCAIGLYGGKPYVGNCRSCISAGENTPEFAASLTDRAARSHPANRQKISGCCDRADNF